MRDWAGEVGATRHRVILGRVRHAYYWWAIRGEREGVGRPLRHRMMHRRHGAQVSYHSDDVMVGEAAVELDRHGRADEPPVRPPPVPNCRRDLVIGPAPDPGLQVRGDVGHDRAE